MRRDVRASLLALGIACTLPGAAHAATVWAGPPLEFAKAAFADPTDPANQDQISTSVSITRASQRGLYNASLESFHIQSVSPAHTEWAFALNNPGKTIAASNFANLEFAPWAVALGFNPPSVVGMPSVLHILPPEDVYIDVTMLEWGVTSAAGGAFRYKRSTPIPLLPAECLAALGLGLLFTLARRASR